VLKNTVRPDSVVPTYRRTETLPEKLRSDDGSEYSAADFYAVLLYSRLVRKSRFPFARLSQIMRPDGKNCRTEMCGQTGERNSC
jgi:hypothetical protein